jgi:hypothetical protein
MNSARVIDETPLLGGAKACARLWRNDRSLLAKTRSRRGSA